MDFVYCIGAFRLRQDIASPKMRSLAFQFTVPIYSMGKKETHSGAGGAGGEQEDIRSDFRLLFLRGGVTRQGVVLTDLQSFLDCQ